MELYHFRAPDASNFGDELNVWMWPQLLPHAFDALDKTIFLGIGSTLFDFFPPDHRKVVFGAGYAGYTPKPVLDDSWRFYFVRGKLTAKAFNLHEDLAIGDAAILIRSCAVPAAKGSFKASFMPHWESMQWGNWRRVCERAGVHFLDPGAPVEQLLSEIAASELVIAEAMHAAIVADALRVPWIAISPIRPKHRMKWYDWASSLDLDLAPVSLSSSNALESLASHRAKANPKGHLARMGGFLRQWREPFESAAVRGLSRLASGTGSLSSDRAISIAHKKMLEKLDELQSQTT